jgi:hypothetical protein
MKGETMDAKTLAVVAESDLERDVLAWINEKAADHNDGAAGVLKDLAHGGCSSGMVNSLVYTADCVAFYQKHMKEIDAMAYAMLSDTGLSPDKAFTQWDETDPFAREDGNQNVLAWFGFEETASNLAQRAGLDL